MISDPIPLIVAVDIDHNERWSARLLVDSCVESIK